MFREFLEAVCHAIGATLDEYAWREVWGLVDRTEMGSYMYGSCLRDTWVHCTLAGQSKALCEFSFESVAMWVLLRVEVPPEVAPMVEAAMLAAQRCRAKPGKAADRDLSNDS